MTKGGHRIGEIRCGNHPDDHTNVSLHALTQHGLERRVTGIED